ncbi:MAG: hypothetical protein WCW14_03110 [Candidatus Paceibacterota bacterium]|jgi:hypothetical protein
MATKQQQYKIKKGPGKFELSMALFASPENGCSQTVLFEFEFDRGLPATSQLAGTWANIFSVEAEDGSRENWNILGTSTETQHHGPFGRKFKVYYNTQRRSGTFTFLE